MGRLGKVLECQLPVKMSSDGKIASGSLDILHTTQSTPLRTRHFPDMYHWPDFKQVFVAGIVLGPFKYRLNLISLVITSNNAFYGPET